MLRDMFPESDTIAEAMVEYDLPDAILDLIIAFYGLSGEAFVEPCFHRLIDMLKEKFDYTLMNTNIACLYGAMLCVMYENPSAKVYRMHSLVEIFRGVGFRSRVSNMMAFGFLENEEDCEACAVKALQLYHAMHNHHGIITGEDDYLATMYMAQMPMETEEIMEVLEHTYKALAIGGFGKGNPLQSLSHQLLISREPGLGAERAVFWHNEFKKAHIKINGSQIACFGLLAELQPPPEAFMSALVTALNEASLLKDGKRLRTLEKTIVILETMKKFYGEGSTISRDYARASLLMLLTGYLFRERLI